MLPVPLLSIVGAVLVFWPKWSLYVHALTRLAIVFGNMGHAKIMAQHTHETKSTKPSTCGSAINIYECSRQRVLVLKFNSQRAKSIHFVYEVQGPDPGSSGRGRYNEMRR